RRSVLIGRVDGRIERLERMERAVRRHLGALLGNDVKSSYTLQTKRRQPPDPSCSHARVGPVAASLISGESPSLLRRRRVPLTTLRVLVSSPGVRVGAFALLVRLLLTIDSRRPSPGSPADVPHRENALTLVCLGDSNTAPYLFGWPQWCDVLALRHPGWWIV